MGVVIANSMVVGRLNAGRLRPKQPGQISAPNQISAEQASQLQAARELDAISAPSIAAPNQINAIPDNTSPPFPMSHARILYDNLLAGSQTSDAGSRLLSPNTYESANFNSVTFTLTESTLMDCFCIQGANLQGVTINFQYSQNLHGDFFNIASTSISKNRPIMVLVSTPRDVRRFRITMSQVRRGIVVSAGIALQMQRPIFGGHNPITMSRQTGYQSRRSESGNFVSRNIIRKGLSGSYEWSNLTDDWVREYFDPFIESARKMPFFIAWRPESYPDEVAYAWTTGDISPSNIGTRNLMSVGMDVQAYGD